MIWWHRVRGHQIVRYKWEPWRIFWRIDCECGKGWVR